MATSNYSWNLPTVGGSEDTWGTSLNANWTALDTLLGGTNATEFAILDGATVTTAELNILDGVTATAAELNILDGVTATAAEINLLDGVTWTLADYNTLTATAAELNVLDGITAIASQAEAEAGTATDKLMTPERTKQAIEALSPAWEFESAETAAGSIITNVAHGLGATPKQVSVVLKCVSASFGYSVGDEVYVQSAIYTAGGRPENFGITYSANATNVTIRMGDSGIRLITTSGTATTDVSLGSFRWVVRASL